MRRRDMGLAIGAGVLLMLVGSFTPVGAIVLEPALRFWFVGVALAVVVFIWRRRGGTSPVTVALGLVAIVWVATIVSWYVLLVVLVFALGPLGP